MNENKNENPNPYNLIEIYVLTDGVGHAKCSNCQGSIDRTDTYCKHCGVKFTGYKIMH